MESTHFDPARAEALVRLIVPSIGREYPNKIAHILQEDGDARSPRALTPMFFGCFDWHSAVHSHWSLVRLCRLFPRAPWIAEVASVLDRSFTADNARGELAYLSRPDRAGFEMPYGMAWLLQLAAELRVAVAADRRAGSDQAARTPDGKLPWSAWYTALEPLEALARERFFRWLSGLPLAIRSGVHGQSAFAMGLALDHARGAGDAELEALIVRQARAFHAGDRDGPIGYEPSAYDFLSPCLAEADLMSRILPGAEFPSWLDAFLPVIDLHPVTPPDRTDGKLVHLDGLNLSRAWMLARIAEKTPDRRSELMRQAEQHLRAGLEGVDSPHYMGTHWLGSFALYAMTS